MQKYFFFFALLTLGQMTSILLQILHYEFWTIVINTDGVEELILIFV